jgi:outer membrane protein OmpA-like peptidoglycan-associated protein
VQDEVVDIGESNMEMRSQEPLVSASDNPFRPVRLCAALLAAAMLSACSSQSWRSSSAMWSDRNAGRAQAAGTAGPQEDAGQSAATSAAARDQSPRDARASSGSDTAQQQSTQADSQHRDASTTSQPVTGESALSEQSDTSPKSGVAGEGSAATDATGADQDRDLQAEQQGAGGDSMGSASTESAAEDATAANATTPGPSSSALTDADSAAAQGATEQDLTGAAAGEQDSVSALSHEVTGAGREVSPAGADSTDRGAAPATGTAASAETAAAGTAAGTETAAAGAAAGAETAAAGAAAESAAGSDLAAAGKQPSASGEGGQALSGQQPGQQEEVIVGLVETPGKKATPTETVIPQTLGGMLPLTLGVEGEGEFDFDKAVLRDQVRSVLDEVAARLKDAEYDRLEIVGHTDRIGTEVYNQYLSERRAWAVARYLIQQGVPVNKLAVEGRGMHEPVTSAQDCTGLSREETITCLQTDRRVVISASIRRVDVNVH